MRDATHSRTTAHYWLLPAMLIVGMCIAKTINVTSFQIADRLSPAFVTLDPDNVFIRITIHHVAQLLISIVLMLVVGGVIKHLSLREFGFNLNGWRVSIKWVLIFCGIWFVVQFGVGYLLVRGGQAAAPGYLLNARNWIGYLAFETLLSGTGEEPMYRGLILGLMLFLWRPLFATDRTTQWVAVAGVTLVFMFDHINFTLQPFAITHFNVLQQLTVLVFGLFYGWLFVRTKSLFGPILAHNLLSGVITIAGTLLFLIADT